LLCLHPGPSARFARSRWRSDWGSSGGPLIASIRVRAILNFAIPYPELPAHCSEHPASGGCEECWRRRPDSNRGIRALQAPALPLGHVAFRGRQFSRGPVEGQDSQSNAVHPPFHSSATRTEGRLCERRNRWMSFPVRIDGKRRLSQSVEGLMAGWNGAGDGI
jgi:hypothetical protein